MAQARYVVKHLPKGGTSVTARGISYTLRRAGETLTIEARRGKTLLEKGVFTTSSGSMSSELVDGKGRTISFAGKAESDGLSVELVVDGQRRAVKVPHQDAGYHFARGLSGYRTPGGHCKYIRWLLKDLKNDAVFRMQTTGPDQVIGPGVAPNGGALLCAGLCTCCVGLLADGVPFDEIICCAACVQCILTGASRAADQKDWGGRRRR